MTDTVKVHVGTLEDMGQRFIAAWHRAGQGEAESESHVTFHDLPALLAALTPKRLELLRYVRHHEVRTVRSLAVEIGRDYKNVHRDVEELTKLGLLARTSGRVVAPYGSLDARFVL
jgi:predicted transcriptional regulator